jgi:uncharacterized protein
MIIDCHCHAGEGDGLTGPWDPRLFEKPSHLGGRGRDRKTVLFFDFHSAYAVANRSLAGIVTRQPDRFFGLAFIHAHRDRAPFLVSI